MIIELNKDNLKVIEGSFLDVAIVTSEFENNPFTKYLIYIENDKVIGYIYYSDIYDRAEINQFEIEVSHRNCGKGSLLLEKFLNVVDKSVTLEVKVDNYSAIAVYEKHGFVKKATRQGYYQGIDGILMERKKIV